MGLRWLKSEFRPARFVPGGVFLMTLSISLSASPGPAAERTHGGYHSEERIANLRRNVERFDWAARQRDEAVAKAKTWVARSDEELWNMIPGQDLPRCIDVTWDYKYDQEPHLGCLKCGDAIRKFGNYPYEPDFEKKPWKLTCPSCGAVFPTNDFGAYYRSGLDESGQFRPDRADRKLLFNTEHPDPSDPHHRYGVDDGFGYIDANGRAHKFIGYYTWKLWRYLTYNGVGSLASAYLYTGDKTYARKAAIMLDRIADVYPDMDWAPYARLGWYHSDGGTKTGKVEGSIWEAGFLANLASNYDMILSGTVDNPELYAFLKRQSERYKIGPKGTRALLLRNIDDNILRCGVKAIHDERIKGNFGMRQRTMIACALALNQQPETEEWIDWNFSPDGGNLTAGILHGIDRDGMGDEGGPGYALGVWFHTLATAADYLEAYKGSSKRSIYREFPSFVRMCSAGWRLAVLDWTTPNIGDSGETGLIKIQSADPHMMLRGFKYGRDPEAAVAAWRANGNSAKGLGRDIFDADPEQIEREVEAIARNAADTTRGGRHLTGYGLASLEFGKGPEGKALWLYYGRTAGHGHRDRLNFGLYAFGMDLTPDLGYPEFAGTQPERRVWTANSISHNVLTVNSKGQRTDWTGFPRHFKRLPGFGAMEVESPNVYPQTRDYVRSMMLVDAGGGNAYAVDFLRAAGGDDHLLSFHGPAGAVTATGLKLVRQASGTYAGENVELRADTEATSPGYSYLFNVERDLNPPSSFVLDWAAEPGKRGAKPGDDVHLRWHVSTECADVALADAEPPRNKPDNPKRLRYALLHREGQDLTSVFASVLEPYRKTPFLKSVRRLKTGDAGEACAALRVEHADGTVDYVISSATTGTVELEEGLRLTGAAAFVRRDARGPVRAVLIRGTELSLGDLTVVSEAPDYTGTVVAMDKDLEGEGELWVDTPLPTDGSLTGENIMIENDRQRSACYEIRRVTREGDRTRISCGPVSFVRGLKDPRDVSKGYVLDFEEGARFSIPRHVVWERP